MRDSRIAIVCAPGIGDALIFLTAFAHLKDYGYLPTLFSPHIAKFGPWLPSGIYSSLSSLQELAKFPSILLQYDNTEQAKAIAKMRHEGKKVFILYGQHHREKHPLFSHEEDVVLDRDLPMVHAVCTALEKLFKKATPVKSALIPPPHLVYRRFPLRVAIHPTSSDPARNWPKERFLKVADLLHQRGFSPFFVIGPQERKEWPGVLDFATLADLASFLYESGYFLGNDSGPGHLASCLGIPNLVIGKSIRHMARWRPGWTQGIVICPPLWLPNFKKFRIREKYGTHFISTKKIINSFTKLTRTK